MCQETEEILKVVRQVKKMAQNQRMVECQNQCMTGFIYYQGVIDSLADMVDNIEKIKAESHRLNGGQEVE